MRYLPIIKFQISKTEVLRSGAYGIVYRGILNGKPVAAKSVKPNADKPYIKALLSEIKIMIYLGKHEHLVELMGANTRRLQKDMTTTRRHAYLPTSYLCMTDLYTWAYQIALGMKYLESKRVIHGDLAARNVLLKNDKSVKLTDFGLSRQLYNYASYVKKNEVEPLPWRWMAVESLRDLNFSSKSDVWAFGLTLWEIFSLGEVPYPGLTWTTDFVKQLIAGLRMGKPTYATQKMYRQIILRTWDTIPQARPDFAMLSIVLKDLRNSRISMSFDAEQDGNYMSENDEIHYYNQTNK